MPCHISGQNAPKSQKRERKKSATLRAWDRVTLPPSPKRNCACTILHFLNLTLHVISFKMFWNPNGLKALWHSIWPRHFRFFRVSSKRSECSEQESKNCIIHQMPFNFDFLLDHSFAECPENVTADVFENVTLGLWKEKKKKMKM